MHELTPTLCGIAFNRIRDIFERVVETKRMQGERRPPVVIVGNKADRGDTDREVSLQMGQNLAAELGADAFFEVSPFTYSPVYQPPVERSLVCVTRAVGVGAGQTTERES